MSVIKEWSAHISCKEHEVGGSFSVFIFLGDVPADPDEWLTDPAFAGLYSVYTNSPDENDSHVPERVVTGVVHLNGWLSEKSGLHSLEENVVVPFLKQKINWAVQSALDGRRVSLDKIPSLEVTVLCTPLKYPVGSKIPIEGDPVYYHDITRGRPGGYHGD